MKINLDLNVKYGGEKCVCVCVCVRERERGGGNSFNCIVFITRDICDLCLAVN